MEWTCQCPAASYRRCCRAELSTEKDPQWTTAMFVKNSDSQIIVFAFRLAHNLFRFNYLRLIPHRFSPLWCLPFHHHRTRNFCRWPGLHRPTKAVQTRSELKPAPHPWVKVKFSSLRSMMARVGPQNGLRVWLQDQRSLPLVMPLPSQFIHCLKWC